MDASGISVFETPIGVCGIVWGPRGIIGVQLPERDARSTRARLEVRFPHAAFRTPPPPVREAIDDIVALLRGEPRSLANLLLDMTGVSPFYRRVYEAARKIPPGATLTYGALATRIGSPGAARAVGQALGKNPFAIVVPCHRVLAANGQMGGFSAAGGVDTKRRMLAIEGASTEKTYGRDRLNEASDSRHSPERTARIGGLPPNVAHGL